MRCLTSFLLLLFIGVSTSVHAQFQTIFFDNFGDSILYKDRSRNALWGTQSSPESGFRRELKADDSGLAFPALGITDSARKYASYQTLVSLKASLAIDYRFPVQTRSNDSMQLDFDVLWDTLVSGGNQGRLVVALLEGLPENIPFGTILDSVGAKAPFGRPAYSFRILNRTPQGVNNYANMMYGGGKDSLGEFEKFNSGLNSWWLPGFISGPGGISPEGSPQYPLGPVNRWTTRGLASANSWRHFSWKIFPEKLEIRTRASAQPEEPDSLTMWMVIPKPGPVSHMLTKLTEGHGLTQPLDSLPTLYRWFPQFNGIRIFFNGTNKAWIANIALKSTFNPVGTLPNLEHFWDLVPNPGGRCFQVLGSGQEEIHKIQVLDGMGRNFGAAEKNEKGLFCLPDLPTGGYALKVIHSKGVRVLRYFKDH